MDRITAPLLHPVTDACTRLNIGRTMLYSLIDRGDIRSIKLGAKTLIPETELQRLIADRLATKEAA